MILGDIRHLDKEQHLYPKAVQRAIGYIISDRLSERPPGKYELEGDDMIALVQHYVTSAEGNTKFESHERYIDIQFLVSGEERIDWLSSSPHMTVCDNRLNSDDIQYYDDNGKEPTELLLTEGMYAIFLPHDLHRPCRAIHEETPVRKVVIKIHRELYGLKSF